MPGSPCPALHDGVLTWRWLQVRMLKESLPHMRAAGKGQVIITTSLLGFSAFPFTDAYAASKFALEGGQFITDPCLGPECRSPEFDPWFNLASTWL